MAGLGLPFATCPLRAQDANHRHSTLPRVVKQQQPKYPYAMRRYGLVGKVIVDFIVDAQGHVRNPYVKSSTNPAFDDNAIKAVNEWTFEPGRLDGRPVATHMQVPIIFQLDSNPFALDGGSPGVEPFRVEAGDQSKLPPQLRYDTPPRIRNAAIPVYPYQDLRDNVKGSASVMLLVNADGRVGAVKIVSATRPEFGYALAAAAQEFEFAPALRKGKPVPFALKLAQTFSRGELPDEERDHLLSVEQKHPERIVSGLKLDAPVKPLSLRPAVFPELVGDKATQGSAVIEGIVDQDGRLRLLRVVKASAPEFGYQAVQAADAWWFAQPKSHGKDARVRVEIPFHFQAK